MRDQTFSAKNFRYISETEKRKGKVKDLAFFPVVKEKTDLLKEHISEARKFRRDHKGNYSEAEQAIFDDIRRRREEARSVRDQSLLEHLNRVSKRVCERSFKVSFDKLTGPGGKSVYQIPQNDPASFYTLKNLDRSISAIYRVCPENRNQIIQQIKGMLNDGFPYHILRLDIKSFFESIPHDALLRKLRDDQLLSQMSLRFISQMLHSYGEKAGTSGVGLPRGLSISSYLSELYMRDFDREIRSSDGIVYYARYVDDILAVFAPPPQVDASSYLTFLDAAISKRGLKINQAKTEQSPIDAAGRPTTRQGWMFEYLGYKFLFSPKLTVRLSQNRLDRYRGRIATSFERYKRQNPKHAKAAYRLLVKRVRFLTGNTQLTHNKSNAYVGVYFSNHHLTVLDDLKQLDGELKAAISKLSSPTLKAKLLQLSFVDGYEQKLFRRFHRAGEFEEIVRAWKYE